MGDELGASVGGDVGGNAMFGKDVKDEQLGQLRGGDGVVGRDKYPLLGEAVNNNQDGCEAGGTREFLNKVHGNRVPGLLRNRELLEEAVGSVSWGLGPSACSTRLAEVLYKCSEVRPDVFTTNKFKRLVLSEMSC